MSYPNRLYINARYAFNEEGEEPQKFSAELPIGIEYVKSIELNQASLVYTPVEPNLSSADNILQITYNGAVLSYTLPARRVYSSPTDLCNVINTITALAVGTFTFDANFVRIDYTPTLPADTWTFDAVPNNILRRMGARNNTASIPAVGTSTGNYQFELYPIILKTSVLYITCSASDTSKTNRNGVGVPDILSMYPMSSGEIGSVLNFQLKNTLVRADAISGSIRNIEFEIRDEDFNIIPFSHNTAVNLELTLQYEEIVSNIDAPFKLQNYSGVMM